MNILEQKGKFILFIIFGVIIYFPIFLHLDIGALHRWDESTNAFHAYEMLENGNYLRRFFLGNPETWETKPPMLTWIQAVSMKIFGYNELAIRLPSALAVLCTIVLIVRFFIKEFNNIWGGIFSSLILLTSNGYVRGHVSRTGDHDALLILFLVTGLIYFYKFLHAEKENRNRHLLIFTAALIGGVLTKSIAGLYFAPGMLIYTILSKKFVPTIRQKHFWFAVFTFFLVVGGYYFSAEYYYPGYLVDVWEMELFPRFFNFAEGHNYHQMPEPYHFSKVLFESNFKWYAWLLPISLFLVWFQKDEKVKKFTLALFTVALTFHVVISNGTYNSWYNAPVFPLLAMIVGIGVNIIFTSLINFLNLPPFRLILFYLAFIFTIFFIPYKSIIIEECYNKGHRYDGDIYGEFFKKIEKHNPEFKDFFVYYEIRNRHFLFYQKVYNEKKGFNIRSCGMGSMKRECTGENSAQIGDRVIVCNKDIKEALQKNFETKFLSNHKKCELFLIEGVKEVEKEGQVEE